MPTPGSHPEPRDVLGYLLKHATLQLTSAADAGLNPLGIDSKDFGVLRLLGGSEPRSQQEIAESIGVDRTTMVALIDALEGQGVVQRRTDPRDRRRNVVELTSAGVDLVQRAEKAYAAVERGFLEPLTAAQARDFQRALRKLVAQP